MEQLPRISPADICRLAGISRASLIDDEKSFDSSPDQSSVLDRIVIIDIRPQDDYQSGTLPGALSLPADSVLGSITFEVIIFRKSSLSHIVEEILLYN